MTTVVSSPVLTPPQRNATSYRGVQNKSFLHFPNYRFLLAKAEKKQFHTIVAKLVYLAKRARPGILTAVAFLTSRILNPTSEDDRKLKCVSRLLADTRSDGLTLRKDFEYPVAYGL